MSSNRYYFSNFIEDDTLSILAVKAKEMLQEIDFIVKIYQKNNELLYGSSPKQMLFLMKQNNKPLYSSNQSPSSGNNLDVAKSNHGPSTPVSRNSDVSVLRRILLSNSPLDDAERKVFNSSTFETSTPVRHQTMNKEAGIFNPTVDKTAKVEQFASPVSSTGSHGASKQDSPRSAELAVMAANLTMDEKDFKNKDTKILNPTVDETSRVDKQFASPVGSTSSPGAGKQDFSRSAEKVMMTASLTMDEKEVGSPVKIAGNTGTDNQESPRSAELIRMTNSLTVEEEDSSSVLAIAEGEFNASNQGTPRYAEVIVTTSIPKLDDKESRTLVAEEQKDANTDSINLGAKSGKSRDPDSRNKGSINPVEETFKIPKPIKVRNETPSPVKRLKMCSISEHLRSRKLNRDQENRLILKNLMAANSADDTDVLNPVKRAEESTNSDSSNEDSVNSAEGTFKILKPTKAENDTFSPVKSEKVLVGEDRTAADTDFLKPGETSGKSDGADSNNKDSFNPAEGMVKIPNPIKVRNETPSPVKRSKMCSISAVGIQKFVSPAEKVKLADTSVSSEELSISPVQDDFTNANPNEASQGIAVDKRKRKSPSPQKRNATIFRSIPRVVQSSGEAEMGIEVPYDSEGSPSPTTSRISSTANSPLSSSPLMSESRADDSPKTVRRILSPSERLISTSSSRNVSRTSSSGSDGDNIFVGNNPSGVSSIAATATGDRSCKSESSVTGNETDYYVFKHTVRKFYTLYILRNQILKKIFTSLSYFQNNIGFLNSYAKNVGCIVKTISSSDKQYSTEELKETVNDAAAIALKLTKKLTSWKTDIELDVNTWLKCFEQMQEMKTHYEPLESEDGEPLMTMETLQVYEQELKAIWKKIDDMIMVGDARRSLFSQTAHDFEKLIKIFVKCLIMVGILQPR